MLGQPIGCRCPESRTKLQQQHHEAAAQVRVLMEEGQASYNMCES